MQDLKPHFFNSYGTFAPPHHLFSLLTEIGLRRTSTLILCSVSLCLCTLSLLFNCWETSYGVVPALLLVMGMACGCSLWVYITHNPRVPLFLMNISLMLLGIYLLTLYEDFNQAQLFWFLLFPPMLMLCSGLRYGSLLFGGFYSLLLLLFFSPLESLLAKDIPPPYACALWAPCLVRISFLLCLNWCAAVPLEHFFRL